MMMSRASSNDSFVPVTGTQAAILEDDVELDEEPTTQNESAFAILSTSTYDDPFHFPLNLSPAPDPSPNATSAQKRHLATINEQNFTPNNSLPLSSLKTSSDETPELSPAGVVNLHSLDIRVSY